MRFWASSARAAPSLYMPAARFDDDGTLALEVPDLPFGSAVNVFACTQNMVEQLFTSRGAQIVHRAPMTITSAALTSAISASERAAQPLRLSVRFSPPLNPARRRRDGAGAAPSKVALRDHDVRVRIPHPGDR